MILRVEIFYVCLFYFSKNYLFLNTKSLNPSLILLIPSLDNRQAAPVRLGSLVMVLTSHFKALWTTGDKQSLLHPSTHGCLGAQVSTLIQSSAPTLPSEIQNAWRTLKINFVDYISVLHPCNIFRSITVG